MGVFRLALALLVTGVFANHHDVSVAANNLALVADGLNAGVDLHCSFPFIAVFVPKPCGLWPLLLSNPYL